MTQQTNNIDVLDHGYVKFIEHWGSDERIVEAARMSTDGAFRGWGPKCDNCGTAVCTRPTWEGYCPTCNCVMSTVPGDEKLLRYLYEHKHSTPFEMAGMVIEVQAPIFVFRQWHRHRTQSYNELSARYTDLPALDYVPTVEQLMRNGGKNKQAGTAKGAEELTQKGAEFYRGELKAMYAQQELLYRDALRAGVPKELARIHLPVARYSRMRASANLRNWLAFLTLRMDSHAQYEIRVFADAVGEQIKREFPRTWGLFAEGRGA